MKTLKKQRLSFATFITKERLTGKQRPNFAAFTTKERVDFPAAIHYPVDRITHVNFMTGKLSAQ
ncbi:MAG TPA: hypothetical protein VIF10_05055 [Methylobacter sp.]